MFDPYREWLGIADERRPPTLYQLLGVVPEADPRAIEAAVNRQLAKVQAHIAGSYSKEAWRIVDEITLAKTTLLDPSKRAAYDSIFGFSRKAAPRVFPQSPSGPPGAPGWEQGPPLPTAPMPAPPWASGPTPTAPMPAPSWAAGSAPGAPTAAAPMPMPPWATGTMPPGSKPTAPFPAQPGQPAFQPPSTQAPAPFPTPYGPPAPPARESVAQEPIAPQGLYTPIFRQGTAAPTIIPTSAPVPASAGMSFLEHDDHRPANDDPSSHGLPTPVGMPKLRTHKGNGAGLMLMIGGIIALAVTAGIIFLATRDKPESTQVADNKEKKAVEPNDKGRNGNDPGKSKAEPNSKAVVKDPKKENKDPKKEKVVEKKTPPKMPDPLPPVEVASEFKDAKLLRGHDSTPRWVAVSPDGRLLLTAGDDKFVFTWSPTADKGSFRKNLNSPATGAAFLPGGKEIIVADGGKIYQIDLATNKETKTWELPANNGSFNAVAVSADGKRMVTAMTIGKILAWDLAKNDYDAAMDATETPVDCVAITGDGKTLFAGARDGTVSAWNTNGKLLKKWMAHKGGVAAVVISPDGRLMGSAGVDKLVRIWDAQTFAEALTLKGHTDVPVGLAWTSDGGMIVSCGADKTIRGWDSVTGLPLRWSHTSTEKVQSLALDPKDRFLIAGLGDSGVQLLFLPAVRPDYPPRSTWVQAPSSPLPVPLPFQIEGAIKTLREKYKTDFALTAPEDQHGLYEKLLARAKVAPDDPASRYAQFSEARSIAVRLNRMDDAFKAVDTMAIWFEIDDLAEKANALKEAGKGTVTRPVVEAVARVIEQAEKLARIDIVDELLRQRELFPQLPDAAEASAKILLAEKRWSAAADDRETGKKLVADWMKDPENAEANLAYGKHLCFRLGQWSEGLARILKGNDSVLKDMAKKDQIAPKDGKGQLDLAVTWRGYADKAEDAIKPGALLRAKFWYDQASRSPDLPAGEKNSATARIGEINRQLEAMPNTPINKGGVPVRRQQFNSIRNDVALESQWAHAGSEALGPGGLAFKGDGTLVSRFRVLDPCRVEFAFVPDGREVTVQLNGESATFKPEVTTAVVFVTAERRGAKVSFSLRSFTGMVLEQKAADLTTGKDEPSAIVFKVSAAPDKDGILIKTIIVNGMVRPLD